MATDLPDEILVWDTETGGVDVKNDRILTCYMAVQNSSGETIREWSWTIDPGVADGFEVAEGAAKVHGMTTEWIAEHGRKDWQVAIGEIENKLIAACVKDVPIVAYNQRFDLSILHHELLRIDPGSGGVHGIIANGGVFYDPLVHDKHREPYRKGGRRLEAVCNAHGIEFNPDEAHEARYDVIKTAELAWHFLRKERLTIDKLYPLLPVWKEEQDSSLEAYFKRSGKKNDNNEPIRIDRGWPLITKKGN